MPLCKKGSIILNSIYLYAINSKQETIGFTWYLHFPGIVLYRDCSLYNPCSQTRKPCSFPTIQTSLEEATIKLKDAGCIVEYQSKGTGTTNRQLRIPLELCYKENMICLPVLLIWAQELQHSLFFPLLKKILSMSSSQPVLQLTTEQST